MDANPFTYEVMADEVARWYTDLSTSPSSRPRPSRAVRHSRHGHHGPWGVVGGRRRPPLGLAKMVPQRPGLGLPACRTGHVRTVVKLPLGWASRSITGSYR